MVIRKLRVPTTIRFDTSHGDFDTLPDEIKSHAGEIDLNSVVFASDGDRLWTVFCRRYQIYTLSDLERFVLWYFTPGKGPGFIYISAGYKGDRQGSASLANFSEYSDAKIASSREICNELEDVSGYIPEEQNHGPYC